jgi:excisionase family DNA binding protein
VSSPDPSGAAVSGTLTLQEAADELGVHYMTAYRYVRLGLLVATKSGGSWQVLRSDLEEFRAPSTSGDDASGHGDAHVGGGRGRKRAPWSQRLEQRLVAGDSRGAWGVIEAALAAGSSYDEVYLEVLTPAMASIGERWARGELGIAVEHRASGIAMRIIGRMGPRFVRRGRSRGSIVVGAPAGERHSIPVAILADLLRQGGWEVSDLGADTPADAFALSVADLDDVVAVGVSVTTPDHLDAAAESLAAVRAVVAPHVLLFVGGRAIDDREHAIALGADDYASDGRSLAELLDRLTDIQSASGS